MTINSILTILLLVLTFYLILNWDSLPNQVPGHFNAQGVVDRWASKGELWILPITSWLMFIGLTILEQFPNVWNTGVKLTKENQKYVYRTTKNMLLTLKFILVLNFVYLSVMSISGENLSMWYLPLVLFLVFGSILFFSIKLHKSIVFD